MSKNGKMGFYSRKQPIGKEWTASKKKRSNEKSFRRKEEIVEEAHASEVGKTIAEKENYNKYLVYFRDDQLKDSGFCFSGESEEMPRIVGASKQATKIENI